jgi:hypothetical protein
VSRVELTPWEREWAEYVGRKRTEANEGKGNAVHYDPSRMQDNLTANIASCVAELAVAKRLNRYWDGSFWTAETHDAFATRADVGENIEVRRIRSPQNPLAVRRRDVERGRHMVLAYPHPDEFVVVDVIGWGTAADLFPLGSPADYDLENTRTVSQSLLNPL